MSIARSLFSVAALSGLSLASTAQAESWKVIQDNMATILMGVDFLDANVGYVAGGQNGIGPVIYRTPDGGRNFVQQVNGMPTATFMDISFGDTTHAVAGGMGMFYMFAGASYTTDGRTWSASQDRWLASAYQDVEAVDGDTMYLIGMWSKMTSYGEGVAASSDGGRSFNYFDWGMGTPARYGSFVSKTTGYVSGGQWPYDAKARYGAREGFRLNRYLSLPMTSDVEREEEFDGYRCTIARTVNGGADWELLYDDIDRFYCNAIDFADEQNGWVVAEGDDGGTILHTSDAGQTWEEQLFVPNGSLLSLRMVDALEGWAAGALIQGLGFKTLFLHTIDGGNTWTTVSDDTKYYVFSIDAVDADHVWATAFGSSGACSLLQYQP